MQVDGIWGIAYIYVLAAILMRPLLPIILLILLIGCKSTIKKIVDKYPNGQTMTEYIYSDGKDTLNFICKVYHENGILKHETQISNNNFIGEKKSFFENGKIQRIEKLSKSTPIDAELYDCHVTNYRINGTKESEYQYINDKLNGIAKDYDSLGNIARTTEYIDGKVNGLSLVYHSNGRLKELANCRNDSSVGFVYEFSDSGDSLKAHVNYGLSVNGVFSKKWLPNGYILTCTYGDFNRSFVIWKWYDRNQNLVKTLIDKGTYVDSNTKKFIEPE